MPQLQQKKNPLSEVSAEDINDTYRKGYISASQKNDLMRRKAQNTIDELLDEQGYFKAILTKAMQNVQEGWTNFEEAYSRADQPGIGDDIRATGKAIWGQVQMLTSVFNAVGEISGAKAEQMALAAGHRRDWPK